MNSFILVRKDGPSWQFLDHGEWHEVARQSQPMSATDALESVTVNFPDQLVAIVSRQIAA